MLTVFDDVRLAVATITAGTCGRSLLYERTDYLTAEPVPRGNLDSLPLKPRAIPDGNP